MNIDVIIKSGINVQVRPTASPTYVIGNLPVLVGSGQQGATQGWVDSGYYPRDNPSGYATGVDGSLFVRKTESGIFYTRDNPSGYLTGPVVQLTGNQIISGIKTFVDTVRFLSGVDIQYIDFTGVTPAPWQEGRVFYDTGSHTLSYYNDVSAVTINLGQEQVLRVRNGEGFTISNGKAVYLSGAQGTHPLVYLSDCAKNNAELTVGLATHDIVSDGYITTFGLVHSLDTRGLNEGTRVYLDSSGNLTGSPMPPPHHRIEMGYVLYEHQNNGIIFVNPIKGESLNEIHDVLITNPQSGQALVYNSTTTLWENQTVAGSINTGSLTGTFYPLSSNPSGFITTGQLIKFSTLLTSGVEVQAVNYPLTLAIRPTSIACEMENNRDNFIYSYVLTGVSNSGFWVCFSDILSTSGYSLYTTITL